jgi:transforming growth factor-beta-induced protein
VYQNLSIFIQQIQQAQINVTLQGSGPYTVFCPTDRAFANLSQRVDINATQQATITQILNYHICPGRYNVSDLRNLTSLRTLQGQNVTINVIGDNIPHQ